MPRDDSARLGNALGLLVTLWARWRVADDQSANKYLGLGGRGRISLRSMFTELDRRPTMTIPAVLTWLLEEYAVGQHMRVATHKLRTEGLDTFWFHADDGDYRLHPEREAGRGKPGYNAPKLWAAMSSLYDLALLKWSQNETYACTSEGTRVLDRILAAETS